MKKIILIVILFSASYCLFPQQEKKEERRGTVTYRSSQNIYVKFETTSGIAAGDTLFLLTKNEKLPAVTVKYISSGSVAGEVLNKVNISVNDIMIAYTVIDTVEKETPVVEQQKMMEHPEVKPVIPGDNNFMQPEKKSYSGRLSVQSYTSLNNYSPQSSSQRWRYSFNFNADNIGDSRLSYTNYIIFTYKADEWQKVKDNVFDGLKIYDLALKYDLTDEDELWAGRHINRKVANIGSIDGVQYERKFSQTYIGALAGSRPDYSDLGFNIKLFEYGAYIGRVDTVNGGYMENTIAVVQQTYSGKTDRRYLYIQHTSNILPRFNFFGSSEIDLYKKEKGAGKSAFTLTGLFFSARYSPANIISFNLSYDARKNVIYYETFKNFTDSLFENETRQGIRGGINFRPWNYVFLGINVGYRYEKKDIKPSRNFSGYLSYTLIPVIEASANLSYNYLLSNYMEGRVAGISLSKDIPFNNSNITFTYRHTDYSFPYAGKLIQQNAVLDFTSRLSKFLYLSISWDATFEEERTGSRVLLDITARF